MHESEESSAPHQQEPTGNKVEQRFAPFHARCAEIPNDEPPYPSLKNIDHPLDTSFVPSYLDVFPVVVH